MRVTYSFDWKVCYSDGETSKNIKQWLVLREGIKSKQSDKINEY